VLAASPPLMPPPPPGAAGPFALSDEHALRRFAADADLTRVEVFDVDSPFVYADEATAIRGLNSAGVAVRAMECAGERAVTRAHVNAITPFRQPDGSYRIKATFRCLLARPY
jgi:hypothetical protein